MKEVGRNDPCPCGSGKKFKKCCGLKTPMQRRTFTQMNPASVKTSLSHITGMVSQTLRENQPKEEPKPLDEKVNPTSPKKEDLDQ